ncbi:MAG: aminotransferase class V-fold PLP-dependent enzyme [Chlorobi bacterium]|nr:aminotransferase class V-fold PLP-dependent enzyme [Chlorobiota bacterium]
MTDLEKYFNQFRENIIGIDASFESPYGTKKIIYADWIASGRLYGPIEDKIKNEIGPYVANTHTETSVTGLKMTKAYISAHEIIKKHVNANSDDILLTTGFGMTGAINKLLRILGFIQPEQLKKYTTIPHEEKPVVFITHMEHHSNQLPWLESIADTVVLPYGDDLLVDLQKSEELIKSYANRKYKIGAFSACSNVTGIKPPYFELAKIMHQNGGYCFIDFAASAPYVEINMHPDDELKYLDAIYFSPHKFLGGPGTSGVLVFSSKLYNRTIPDHPGGGPINWTNPWGGRSYFDNPELREDGGTPGFMLAIRTALVLKLKEKMGIEKMIAREKELLEITFKEINKIDSLHILAENVKERIGVVSFYSDKIHYNLIIKLLNDRFGIQIRGGCVCAGTYGHVLYHITKEESKRITDKIDSGDLSEKPGWARLSIHPTMTNDELYYILDAIKQIVTNINSWKEDYIFDKSTNEFYHKSFNRNWEKEIEPWFRF